MTKTTTLFPGQEMFKAGSRLEKIPQFGKLITEPQFRDAVHIAVAPVVAGENLIPGTRIGFSGYPDTVGVVDNIIGIVDPFLQHSVKKGDTFYMFLLPNTITSLRHEWTHPAFEEIEDLEKTFKRLKGAVAEEQWISDFAENIGSNYHEMMESAKEFLENGDYLVRGGTFEGVYIPDEFWDKYEIIKNATISSSDRGSFLGCSC